MCRAQQSRLLVIVTDRTEIPTHNLKLSTLSNKVNGHLEHAQMEVGDGAEGAAGDEHDGLLLGVAQHSDEAVMGKLVVRHGASCA